MMIGHHLMSSAACTQKLLLDHPSSRKKTVKPASCHAARSTGFREILVSPETTIHPSLPILEIHSTSGTLRLKRSDKWVISTPCDFASSWRARAIETEMQLSRKNLTQQSATTRSDKLAPLSQGRSQRALQLFLLTALPVPL